MFCKNCGVQIADSSKFCDNCGTQTNTEQANIQAQTMQIRRQNPPPHKKTAAILTIMFWVLFPGVGWLLSEGEPVFVGIMCGAAAVFTAFTWIMCMYSYNKYMKNTDSQDINRKQ